MAHLSAFRCREASRVCIFIIERYFGRSDGYIQRESMHPRKYLAKGKFNCPFSNQTLLVIPVNEQPFYYI